MKLSWLRRKLIWRVERDEVFDHHINLYDIFGRKLMTLVDPSKRWVGDVWAGDGHHFEDDIPQR